MPEVKIKEDDDFQSYHVEAGQTLLEIHEEQDTDLMFGCCEGHCGTCKVFVTEGKENLSPMEEKEKKFLESIDAKPEERLACQCKVSGDVQLIISDYGLDDIFD